MLCVNPGYDLNIIQKLSVVRYWFRHSTGEQRQLPVYPGCGKGSFLLGKFPAVLPQVCSAAGEFL